MLRARWTGTAAIYSLMIQKNSKFSSKLLAQLILCDGFKREVLSCLLAPVGCQSWLVCCSSHTSRFSFLLISSVFRYTLFSIVENFPMGCKSTWMQCELCPCLNFTNKTPKNAVLLYSQYHGRCDCFREFHCLIHGRCDKFFITLNIIGKRISLSR